MIAIKRLVLRAVLACALAAPASAQNVLVLNSAPSAALAWYSGFASLTVDYASDATWMAMTPAQFAAYDLIWIGGLDTITGSGTQYSAAFTTRAAWAPAITGRAIVTCMHISTTVHARAEAMTYVDDSVAWLLGGGGTALWVGTDGGTRAYDFLDSFGITGCSGLNCFNNNAVNIVAPTHPSMTRSTSAGLSNWAQSNHNRIVTFGTGWEVLAQGPGGEILVIARSLACNITSPGFASVVTGDASFLFDAFHPSSAPLTTRWEFTTDGGATYSPCTAAATSPLANPDVVATPALGQQFIWDTEGDGVGIGLTPIVQVRLVVSDSLSSASCTTTVIVNNPTCGVGSLSCGDCDTDSFITVLDALRAAEIDVGRSTAPATGTDPFNACNVTGTPHPSAAARISILDALKIARHVVGLTPLTCCTP